MEAIISSANDVLENKLSADYISGIGEMQYEHN